VKGGWWLVEDGFLGNEHNSEVESPAALVSFRPSGRLGPFVL